MNNMRVKAINVLSDAGLISRWDILRRLETLTDKELLGGGWCRIDGVNLNNLATLEQLPDGSMQRQVLMPKVMATYNGRLSLANVMVKERDTFPIGIVSSFVAQSSKTNGSVTVYIEEDGTWITTTATFPADRWGSVAAMPGYFFYPNPNAKYVHFDTNRGSCWMKLKQHPFLYGAYYFDGYYGYKAGEVDIPTEISESLYKHNYMYTSEVDNPFLFPASGVNAIGSGEIVAIKTATKAMSQGTAFGTNPLYAFCTDGIWALEVGATGVFAAKQPVSRETLAGGSALSATQIDNSILFLSERGLMELVGGETRLLSGALQEMHSTFDVTELPHWADIMERFGGGDYLEADDFMDYVEGARIAFDYVRYRVIVFRPYDESDAVSHVAYVYDMGSKMWGTVESRMRSVVEDGAATMVNYVGVDGNVRAGEFVKGGEAIAGGGMGVYTTRPLKLGAADTLKTVRTLVERSFTQSPRYLAMWGGRDMKSWSLVCAVAGGRMPRLSGTPYKYFIVAGWVRLTINGDAISRLTMDVKEKYTDKLR